MKHTVVARLEIFVSCLFLHRLFASDFNLIYAFSRFMSGQKHAAEAHAIVALLQERIMTS